MNQKIKLIAEVMTLFSVLFIALFGLTTTHMNMNTEKGMAVNMSPCPYMAGGSSICKMNLFEHISAWQNALMALPIKNIILLVVSSFLFVAFAFFNTKEIRRLYEKYTRTKIQLYEKLIPNHPIPLFVSLFSQGILNTKSY